MNYYKYPSIVVCILFCVAIASIFLFLFTIDMKLEGKNFIYLSSVLGASFFVFHTLFLDGFIWVTFFNNEICTLTNLIAKPTYSGLFNFKFEILF